MIEALLWVAVLVSIAVVFIFTIAHFCTRRKVRELRAVQKRLREVRRLKEIDEEAALRRVMGEKWRDEGK